MRVYGLDFTAAPTKRKPITCAECIFRRGVLHLESFKPLHGFQEFEEFLDRPGPWIAGIDFPFGQPWKFTFGCGLPGDWEGYVTSIQDEGKSGFKALVEDYKQDRAEGDREHLRVTDALADSRSPMKLFGIPVGKMFFEGAPRLLEANVSIIPCREQLEGGKPVVIEAYPALVARRFCGRDSYKNDAPSKQTPEQEAARRRIVKGVAGDIGGEFGFGVELGEAHAEEMIRDASGDTLDAVLCAIQAAWAYTMRASRSKRYGVPAADHPVIRSEGWIVDPVMVQGALR